MKPHMCEMDRQESGRARTTQRGRTGDVVKPAEINQRATAYIAQHPEIWTLALERARQIEEAEEAHKAARRKKRKPILIG